MNIIQLLVSSSDFSASKQEIIESSYFTEKTSSSREAFIISISVFWKHSVNSLLFVLILPDVTKTGTLFWLESLFLQLLWL